MHSIISLERIVNKWKAMLKYQGNMAVVGHRKQESKKKKVCLNLFSTLLDIFIETQDDEEEDDKNHKIFISDISLLIDEL